MNSNKQTINLTNLTEMHHRISKGMKRAYYINETSGIEAIQCKDCGEVKPADEFSKLSSGKTGKQSYCKDCSKKNIVVWKDDNAVRWADYLTDYYSSLWGKAVNAIGNAKANAIKYGVTETITPSEYCFLFNLNGGACEVCGVKDPDNLVLDHHFPQSKGYSLGFGNAAVLCGYHNKSKGKKLPKDFYDAPTLERITAKQELAKSIYSNWKDTNAMETIYRATPGKVAKIKGSEAFPWKGNL